jgi:hypothetical protein
VRWAHTLLAALAFAAFAAAPAALAQVSCPNSGYPPQEGAGVFIASPSFCLGLSA